MHRIITTILIFFILDFTHDVKGQELWINAMPMHYHPSFAGNIEQLRMASNNNIRFLHDGFENANHLSVDKFIGKIHSGVGMELQYSNGKYTGSDDRYLGFRWNYWEGRIIVAPKFSFKGKYTLSPSLQLSTSNTTRFITLKDLDGLPSTQKYTVNNFAFKGGLLLNTLRFFIGLTYTIPNGPKKEIWQNNINNSIVTYRNIDFITGYIFRKSENSKFSFTPIILLGERPRGISESFNSRSGVYSINLALNFKYKKMIGGIDYYRNLMLGFESKKLRVMLIQKYTREAAASDPDNAISNYTAQLSLKYLFGPKS